MNKRKPLLSAGLLAVLALIGVGQAPASVVIDTTRIIYPAKEREITIKVNNTGDTPALTQAWIDRGDANQRADQADAPFLINPPLTRIEPNRGQAFRISFVPEPLPTDRESLFYFNLLDVPPLPKDTENYMQMAFRSRIKLFYRPVGLPGDAAKAARSVAWSLVPAPSGGYALRGKNTSAFYVSFSDVALNLGGHSYQGGNGMIAPGASEDIPLQGAESIRPPAQGDKSAAVLYHWMSDYGAAVEEKSSLVN